MKRSRECFKGLICKGFFDLLIVGYFLRSKNTQFHFPALKKPFYYNWLRIFILAWSLQFNKGTGKERIMSGLMSKIVGMVVLALFLSGCFGGVNPNQLAATDKTSRSLPASLTGTVQVPGNLSANLEASVSALQAAAASENTSIDDFTSLVAAPDGTVMQFLDGNFAEKARYATTSGVFTASLNAEDFIDPSDPEYVTIIVRSITGSGGDAYVQIGIMAKPLADLSEAGNDFVIELNPYSTAQATPIFKDLNFNPLNPNASFLEIEGSADIILGRDLENALRLHGAFQDLLKSMFSTFMESVFASDRDDDSGGNNPNNCRGDCDENGNKISPAESENNGNKNSKYNDKGKQEKEGKVADEYEKFELEGEGGKGGKGNLDEENVHYLNFQFNAMALMLCRHIVSQNPPPEYELWDIQKCFLTGQCQDRDGMAGYCASELVDYIMANDPNANQGSEEGGDTPEAIKEQIRFVVEVGLNKMAILVDAFNGVWIHTNIADLDDAGIDTLMYIVLRSYTAPAMDADTANIYAHIVSNPVIQAFDNKMVIGDAVFNLTHFFVERKPGVMGELIPENYKQSYKDESTGIDPDFVVDFEASGAAIYDPQKGKKPEQFVKKVSQDQKHKVGIQALPDKDLLKGLVVDVGTEILIEFWNEYKDEINDTDNEFFDQTGFTSMWMSFLPVAMVSTTIGMVSVDVVTEFSLDAVSSNRAKFKEEVKKRASDIINGDDFGGGDGKGGHDLSNRPTCNRTLLDGDGMACFNYHGTDEATCEQYYAKVHADGGTLNSPSEYHNCYWGDGGGFTGCWYHGNYGRLDSVCTGGSEATCGNDVCEPGESANNCSEDCNGGTTFGECWNNQNLGTQGADCNCYNDCKNKYCNSVKNECVGDSNKTYCFDLQQKDCDDRAPGTTCNYKFECQ
jgi:hypothetical protein